MKQVRLLLLLGGMIACGGPNDTSRLDIVGGSNVDVSNDATARSTVALTFGGNVGCTATIIGPNQVVTAAHCLEDTNGLTLGHGARGQSIPGISVKGVRIHPGYRGVGPNSGSGGMNDIGVIAFDGSLPSNLQPVKIGETNAVTAGTQLILAGYGQTREQRGSGVGQLRRVNVQVARADANAKEIFLQVGTRKGACYGDSGGPAFLEKGGELLVVGATSRAERTDLTCDDGQGVYTDVRLFQGWMKCAFDKLGKPLSSLADDASASDCNLASSGSGSGYPPTGPGIGSMGPGIGSMGPGIGSMGPGGLMGPGGAMGSGYPPMGPGGP